MFGVTFGGTCTRVLDGDTIEVEVRRTIRIRILDCWAAEIRRGSQADRMVGKAAKVAMCHLVMGRGVEIHVPIEGDAKAGDSTSFGRVLGHVMVDGVSVATVLVSYGYATQEKPKEGKYPAPDHSGFLAFVQSLRDAGG